MADMENLFEWGAKSYTGGARQALMRGGTLFGYCGFGHSLQYDARPRKLSMIGIVERQPGFTE
jgi:hypothetical protein